MSIKHLINAYTPETKEVILNDDLKVVFIEASFDESFAKFTEIPKLLNGALKAKKVEHNGEPTLDLDVDFTAISNNFANGELKGIEKFIRKNCKLFLREGDNWTLVLPDEMSFAFNMQKGAYIPFLVDGAKFHFAKHLPSGNGLLASLASKAMNKLNAQMN